MMSVISVQNIQKKFKVYFDKSSNLKEKVLFQNRNYYEERFVLKGVSFEVNKGETIGLIGENGCGKSTMLKLLTKIMYPDQGKIEIKGRVSSLIELGAGFHPDMSGRENIYTNASIFGLTGKEIEKRIDDIIDFSELEEFIDNPVRTYSSGMYMRLAFSVAIHVDADVLLIDEILAVGDANFQAKCFNKLLDLKSKGVTIVIVSHSLGQIEQICDRAIWISKGEIASAGAPRIVIDSYLEEMNQKRIKEMSIKENTVSQEELDQEVIPEAKEEIDTSANHFGLRYVEITKAQVKNQAGEITTTLVAGESATIEIHYKVHQPVKEYVFGVGFLTMDQVSIVGCNTFLDGLTLTNEDIGESGIVEYEIKRLPLLSGVYALNVAVVDESHTPMDYYRDYCHIEVISKDKSTGFISLEHKWNVR